jgi:hypothetical protein
MGIAGLYCAWQGTLLPQLSEWKDGRANKIQEVKMLKSWRELLSTQQTGYLHAYQPQNLKCKSEFGG